jgi:hypothetical protein
MTLEVDRYGNVLKSLAIGYGRTPGLGPLDGDDKATQERTHITCTENEVTEAIDDALEYPNDYLAPLPCEIRTYEVTGFELAGAARFRFSFEHFADNNFQALLSRPEIQYEEPTDHTKNQNASLSVRARAFARTICRPDLKSKDSSHALPGESYKLAFTPGLLDQAYVRPGA